MSWWAVLVGTVLVALSFGAGSLVSGRRLDEAHAQGWERCAAKIRRRQIEHLRGGYVLVLAGDGPRWVIYSADPLPPGDLATMPQLDEADPADEVPHLGEFVPGEATHVSERTEEPLRSPGGVIPELAKTAEEFYCPCCRERLTVPDYDPPFCWDCGLYVNDPASECDNEHHETPASVSPSAGAGLEPPGSGGLMEDPEVRQSDVPHHAVIPSAGPGADPLFAPLDDDSAFALIRWELKRLAWIASEPFTLTAWQATA